MAENLFVCDVDYDILGCKSEDYWNAEDEVLAGLVSVLSEIVEHGVVSGDAHDSFVILQEAVETIYNNSKGQGTVVRKSILDFLNRIDEIDLKLYGG